MIRRRSIAVVYVLLSSCAADADRYDRSFVSPELEARAGAGLGPGVEPGETAIPDGVNLENGVSEDEAVAIALWNNAAFQEALAMLGFQRAALIEAGLLPNPVFSVFFPVGPKQLEFAVKFPLEVIWLRPGRVARAELECERAAALLVGGGLDLVRDVRTAYADVILARGRARLGEDLLALRGRILAFFETRLRAGAVSELEASKARIKALEAGRQSARLVHEVALAEERLRALLGLGMERTGLDFSGETAEIPRLHEDEEDLLDDALAARPDLRAAELEVQAAGERAGLAPWEFLSLSGILDANEEGKEGFEAGPGLELAVPLFNWNQGGVARADAELERAARRYVTVRHAIAREVAEARRRFLRAAEDLESWGSRIIPAREVARRQAKTAHEKGQISALPVLEMEEELVQARLQEAEARAEARRAKAALERSLGRRLHVKRSEDR